VINNNVSCEEDNLAALINVNYSYRWKYGMSGVGFCVVSVIKLWSINYMNRTKDYCIQVAQIHKVPIMIV
jgi:hypothetical protein